MEEPQGTGAPSGSEHYREIASKLREIASKLREIARECRFPGSAMRTFWVAVSSVNGGNGGRLSEHGERYSLLPPELNAEPTTWTGAAGRLARGRRRIRGNHFSE